MPNSNRKPRIAIDGMGGDHAPAEVVIGTVAVALENPDADWILVGDESLMRECLKGRTLPKNVIIKHASQVIKMDESPVTSIRKKKDASLVVCARLVKEGQADGFFSAGHSGAALAVGALIIGRIPGVDRPAITVPMPSVKGHYVLIDAGANVDCDHTHLVEFAVMGMVYAQTILGVKEPRIGLISNGEEDTKGNQLVKSANRLLRASGLPFIGNIEGREMFEGKADVVVCDGFVGNLVLKTAEGVGLMLMKLIQREVEHNPLLKLPMALMMTTLKRLKRHTDPDEYGGAHLLGVNSVVVIGHGSSHARAVTNGLKITLRAVKQDMVARISEAMAERAEMVSSLPFLLQEGGPVNN